MTTARKMGQYYFLAILALALLLVAVWVTGGLSWPVFWMLATLFALCPIGINWSWPLGQETPSHLRGSLSLVLIAIISSVVFRLSS